LGIWLFIRGKETANELLVLANIIMPFLIGIGFICHFATFSS